SFGPEVEAVQDVLAVVALAAHRDRAAWHGTERVGPVPGQRERVVEGKAMTEATVEFQDERLVLVSWPIGARQNLPEIGKVCSIGGAVLPIPQRVGGDLVQIWAVDEVIGV